LVIAHFFHHSCTSSFHISYVWHLPHDLITSSSSFSVQRGR
jgi:hypothetical protein